METESFRERNRLRRARNAFEHLREYARGRNVADPDAAAREAAEQLHSEGGAQERAERQRRMARASAERAAAEAVEVKASAERAAPAPPAAAPAASPTRPKKGKSSESGAGKAARATSAPAASSTDGESVSMPHRLEDRTKEQLYTRAQELEIEGRSGMTKEELIEAIRSKQ
jgi:hypothetical protein